MRKMKTACLVGISILAMAPMLVAAQPSSPSSEAPSASDAETLFWQSIADSKNTADYLAYLQTYPNGRFTAQAKAAVARIDGNTRAQANRTMGTLTREREFAPTLDQRILAIAGSPFQWNLKANNFEQDGKPVGAGVAAYTERMSEAHGTVVTYQRSMRLTNAANTVLADQTTSYNFDLKNIEITFVDDANKAAGWTLDKGEQKRSAIIYHCRLDVLCIATTTTGPRLLLVPGPVKSVSESLGYDKAQELYRVLIAAGIAKPPLPSPPAAVASAPNCSGQIHSENVGGLSTFIVSNTSNNGAWLKVTQLTIANCVNTAQCGEFHPSVEIGPGQQALVGEIGPALPGRFSSTGTPKWSCLRKPSGAAPIIAPVVAVAPPPAVENSTADDSDDSNDQAAEGEQRQRTESCRRQCQAEFNQCTARSISTLAGQMIAGFSSRGANPIDNQASDNQEMCSNNLDECQSSCD